MSPAPLAHTSPSPPTKAAINKVAHTSTPQVSAHYSPSHQAKVTGVQSTPEHSRSTGFTQLARAPPVQSAPEPLDRGLLQIQLPCQGASCTEYPGTLKPALALTPVAWLGNSLHSAFANKVWRDLRQPGLQSPSASAVLPGHIVCKNSKDHTGPCLFYL